MSVRTTIDIPDELYATLRHRAASEHTSIRALVVDAIDTKFRGRKRTQPVTGPLVRGAGKRGPKCPDRENPYDLIFG